jgi:hypothetical protein
VQVLTFFQLMDIGLIIFPPFIKVPEVTGGFTIIPMEMKPVTRGQIAVRPFAEEAQE